MEKKIGWSTNRKEVQINEAVARKVLDTVDAGLVNGLGRPKPGSMCVEAAVCYALGLPHGDDPQCVSRALRQLKIRLNDSKWSSPAARAKGLRRLALVQLGSAGTIDDREFAKRVAELAIRKSVPAALRSAASIQKDPHHASALRDAADFCEKEGTEETARRAYDAAAAAADAAYAAADARDKSLADFCEAVVQILIEMKAPGAQWFALTEPL